MKDYLAIGVAVVAVVIALLGGSETVREVVNVGASPGPDVYEETRFHDGLYGYLFAQGGGVLQFTATTTQSARTLTQAELADNIWIDVMSTTSPALTLTLPATSTLTTLIPEAGDCRAWVIMNNHAAATTTTIAAGTGWDLMAPSTADDVIDGLELSYLVGCRQSDGDVTGILSDENVHAD